MEKVHDRHWGIQGLEYRRHQSVQQARGTRWWQQIGHFE